MNVLSLVFDCVILFVCLCCLCIQFREALKISWILKQIEWSGLSLEYVMTHQKEIKEKVKRDKCWNSAKDRYEDLAVNYFDQGPYQQTTTQKPNKPEFSPKVVHDFQVFNNGDYKSADRTEWFKKLESNKTDYEKQQEAEEKKKQAVSIDSIPTVNSVEELDPENAYSVDQSKPEKRVNQCDQYVVKDE